MPCVWALAQLDSVAADGRGVPMPLCAGLVAVNQVASFCCLYAYYVAYVAVCFGWRQALRNVALPSAPFVVAAFAFLAFGRCHIDDGAARAGQIVTPGMFWGLDYVSYFVVCPMFFTFGAVRNSAQLRRMRRALRRTSRRLSGIRTTISRRISRRMSGRGAATAAAAAAAAAATQHASSSDSPGACHRSTTSKRTTYELPIVQEGAELAAACRTLVHRDRLTGAYANNSLHEPAADGTIAMTTLRDDMETLKTLRREKTPTQREGDPAEQGVAEHAQQVVDRLFGATGTRRRNFRAEVDLLRLVFRYWVVEVVPMGLLLVVIPCAFAACITQIPLPISWTETIDDANHMSVGSGLGGGLKFNPTFLPVGFLQSNFLDRAQHIAQLRRGCSFLQSALRCFDRFFCTCWMMAICQDFSVFLGHVVKRFNNSFFDAMPLFLALLAFQTSMTIAGYTIVQKVGDHFFFYGTEFTYALAWTIISGVVFSQVVPRYRTTVKKKKWRKRNSKSPWFIVLFIVVCIAVCTLNFPICVC